MTVQDIPERPETLESENRRDFLKTSAAMATTGLVLGAGVNPGDKLDHGIGRII